MEIFRKHPLLILAVIGVAIRLLISPFLSHPDDVSMWALVCDNLRAGEGLYASPGYDYTPGWGYILAIITQMCNILGVGTLVARPESALILVDFNHYGIISTVSFNFVLKLFLIAVDVGVAFMLYKVAEKLGGTDNQCLIAFGLWMLLPPTILVTAAYGNFDCITVLFFLISLYFLLERRYDISGIALGIVIIVKFFPAAAIVPILFYILKKSEDKSDALRSVGIFILAVIATVLVFLIPQFIEGTIGEAFHMITYRLYANGASSTITAAGWGKLLLFAMAGVFLVAFTWFMFKKINSPEKSLIYSGFLAIVAVAVASDNLQQYCINFLPLLILMAVIYNPNMKWAIVAISIVFIIRLFNDLPGMLMSIAEYTSLLSVDTIAAMIHWQATDGFGHAAYTFLSSKGGFIMDAAVFIAALFMLWEYKRTVSSTPE